MKQYTLKNALQNLIIMLSMMVLISACSHYSLKDSQAQYISMKAEQNSVTKTVQNSEAKQTTDTQIQIHNETLQAQFSPVLKIYDAHKAFNRIGTPKANSDGSVYVDSEEANFFTLTRNFEIEDRKYTNLFYRVHFSKIPFSLFPYHLSWGKNVGLIFVVTLNEAKQPVLFTAVHTCGCYKALMGTSFTPDSFFPDKWDNLDSQQNVYGERLTRRIPLDKENPDICVGIRPQEHRVMDIRACNKDYTRPKLVAAYPLKDLRTLESDNGPVSFFHEQGIQEGFVKGAIKPWETLLLSWPSMDFFIGTDKAYLRDEDSENTFYTSIKPWNRETTDMADFPRFLEYWGWKL